MKVNGTERVVVARVKEEALHWWFHSGFRPELSTCLESELTLKVGSCTRLITDQAPMTTT